ncbi:MAG: hypothetical protein M3460_26940 [Actinomycetota bacterium]|nr:hypothetical protein [Actinomycetota bacterium]
MQTLVTAGLTDLSAALFDSERYTYVYEGNSPVLDYVLFSSSLVSGGSSYDVVHTNVEFAAQLSDHDPQVAKLTIP